MSTIKPDYVRLKQAAIQLNTDEDTLLLAAIEGRIVLYVLVNAFFYTGLKRPGAPYDEENYVLWDKLTCAADLLRDGKARIFSVTQEEIDEGQFIGGPIDNEDGYVDVTLDQVFMWRFDIEKILDERKSLITGAVPAIVSTQPSQSSETNRVQTLLSIIRALLHGTKIDPVDRNTVSKIQRWSDEAKDSVSDDTIRSYLKQISDT